MSSHIRIHTAAPLALGLALVMPLLSASRPARGGTFGAVPPAGDRLVEKCDSLLPAGFSNAGTPDRLTPYIIRAGEEARQKHEAERRRAYVVIGGIVAVVLLGKSVRRRSPKS